MFAYWGVPERAARERDIARVVERLATPWTRSRLLRLSPYRWLAGDEPVGSASLPLTADRGAICLIDGHLTNATALRREMTPQPSADTSDARLVELAYAQWGEAVFDRLEGPYALMLADPPNDRLYLAREVMGRRTAYFASVGPARIVARELQALLHWPGISRDWDRDCLISLFDSATPLPRRTALAGIDELLPGEWCMWSPAGERRGRRAPRLWSSEALPGDDACWVDTFRAELSSAVDRSLIGTSEVAVMLSGGMDSGPVAALAAARLRSTGRRLTVTSWQLRDFPACDESNQVTETSAALGAKLMLGDGNRPYRRFDASQWTGDPGTPLTNPFRPLKDLCFRQARAAGCSTVLAGVYGDTLYPSSGYWLLEALRDGDWRRVGTRLARLLRRGGPAYLWRDAGVRMLLQWVTGRQRQAPRPAPWLSASARAGRGDAGRAWPPESLSHPRTATHRARFGLFITSGLAGEQSVARRYGVDWRDPCCDERLAALMLELPIDMHFRKGQTKWVAREAMRGLLPESHRLAPRRGLLDALFRQRLQDALAAGGRQRLLSRQARWPEFIDRRWLLDALESPRNEGMALVTIWQCLSFERWCDWLEGRNPPGRWLGDTNYTDDGLNCPRPSLDTGSSNAANDAR